jgi:hypothetical protein
MSDQPEKPTAREQATTYSRKAMHALLWANCSPSFAASSTEAERCAKAVAGVFSRPGWRCPPEVVPLVRQDEVT